MSTSKRLRVNNQISAPQVRLIGSDGTQLGIVDASRALELAKEKGLDLVEVSPKAEPPVCRILDYGAYLYQQEKKDKKQRAKQKKVEIKGVRLSLKIGPHDLEIRKNQALKFLEKGNKVKVELILRGREKAYAGRAQELLRNFSQSISETKNITIEKDVSLQGGRLYMILGSK